MSDTAGTALPDNALSMTTLLKALPLQIVRLARLNLETQGVFLMIGAVIVGARFVLLNDAWSVTTYTWLASLRVFVVASSMAVCGYLFFDMTKTRSLSASFRFLWSDVFTWRNAATALPAFAMAAAVMNSFSHFKSNIAVFHPYGIDIALAELDRWLHLGRDPWALTRDLIGYGMQTKLLDTLYYLWFAAVFVPTAAFIGSPARTRLRHRYLIGYVFVWGVLGIAGATLFSSVGPIYFDRIYGGPSQFSGLVETLGTVSSRWQLQTMDVREALWMAYVGQSSSIISGISAMPSIHNAMCVLLVLVALNIGRRLALLAIAFALVIFVGSIHLGWHYAVDAYASAIGVLLLWKFAGFLAESNTAVAATWAKRPAVQAD